MARSNLEEWEMLNVPTVVADLENHVTLSLDRSRFFSDLRAGHHSMGHLHAVFSQYYWWRNRFHRWFGVCIAKAPGFGTDAAAEFILSELIEHIEEEISGDHHGMCQTFLRELGVTDLSSIRPIRQTQEYTDSFSERFMCTDRSGEEALAALAGRELVAPTRNRITIDALSQAYGVTKGLEFFSLHEELEVEHFKGLWEAVAKTYSGRQEQLVDAAKSEVTLHVQFWDDVSEAVG
jgi:pyrroloquinoline quinone (PQQ) biosynthesis protein C